MADTRGAARRTPRSGIEILIALVACFGGLTTNSIRHRLSASLRAPAAAVVACVVLALSMVVAPDAGAHAAFESVEPADGASVAAAPKSVVITFTKEIEDSVEEVVLAPPKGAAIEDAWTADGTQITIKTPAPMAAGTWGVKWRVLGGDGHPLTGSSVFVVGGGTASNGSAGASGTGEHASMQAGGAHEGMAMASTYPHTELERLALGGRILFFGGLLFFTGGVIFAVAAAPGWQPRFWKTSLAAVVAGTWIVLGTHVAMVDERSLLAMLNPLAWLTDVVSVGVRGYVLAMVLVLLIHLFRWQLEPIEWEERDAGVPMLLVGLVIAAAAAPSLSGHAADGTMLWVRIPLDMLHVLAGATWLGGLAQVFAIAVRRRSLDSRMFPMINRYATLAAASVGVLVVTGVYATLNELDAGIGELIGSTWGRLVLLKIVLLGLTLPLANKNRLRNVPDVGRDPVEGVPRLRRFVALELVVIVWVIGATAMLVYETPPSSKPATQSASAQR